MRAIVIDPASRSVKEVDITGDLDSLQVIVEGLIERAAQLPSGDDLFVNEEGIYKGWSQWFDIGAHQPFVGPGVIIGHTRSGKSAAARSSVEEIKKNIKFLMNVGGRLVRA